jgi:acyl carrier protein
MAVGVDVAKAEIRAKIRELAPRGVPANLDDEEIIPATGILDSTGILTLVAWFEERFMIELAQDEVNIDNLGTVAAMANFAIKRGRPSS